MTSPKVGGVVSLIAPPIRILSTLHLNLSINTYISELKPLNSYAKCDIILTIIDYRVDVDWVEL